MMRSWLFIIGLLGPGVALFAIGPTDIHKEIALQEWSELTNEYKNGFEDGQYDRFISQLKMQLTIFHLENKDALYAFSMGILSDSKAFQKLPVGYQDHTRDIVANGLHKEASFTTYRALYAGVLMNPNAAVREKYSELFSSSNDPVKIAALQSISAGAEKIGNSAMKSLVGDSMPQIRRSNSSLSPQNRSTTGDPLGVCRDWLSTLPIGVSPFHFEKFAF